MAKYNGWTNYETWVVKLWIDNEESSHTYWRRAAVTVWNTTSDKKPNPYMDHRANAQSRLADMLKVSHDSGSNHRVFKAADGSVYADLLNAALSEVNWHEIAQSLLEDVGIEVRHI